MKLNMLTFTKQDSIIIAATLGVALGVPLSIVDVFSSSNVAMQHRSVPVTVMSSAADPSKHVASRDRRPDIVRKAVQAITPF
jgi:hypothetical protein